MVKDVANHEISCELKKEVEMSCCPAVFRSRGILTMHMKYSHEIKQKFACNNCGKTFYYPGSLQTHLNIGNCCRNEINQSNFYSANIPGVARLTGATARLVFKCEVVEVVP